MKEEKMQEQVHSVCLSRVHSTFKWQQESCNKRHVVWESKKRRKKSFSGTLMFLCLSVDNVIKDEHQLSFLLFCLLFQILKLTSKGLSCFWSFFSCLRLYSWKSMSWPNNLSLSFFWLCFGDEMLLEWDSCFLVCLLLSSSFNNTRQVCLSWCLLRTTTFHH